MAKVRLDFMGKISVNVYDTNDIEFQLLYASLLKTWGEDSVNIIELEEEKSSLDILIKNVQGWSVDRKLDKANPDKQIIKLLEEFGELARGVLKDDKELVVDSLGDMLVVLIILHQQLGLTLEKTLQVAWEEIKNRKGETKNGVFIKKL